MHDSTRWIVSSGPIFENDQRRINSPTRYYYVLLFHCSLADEKWNNFFSHKFTFMVGAALQIATVIVVANDDL